jgi:hypothetical protein
MWFYAFRVLVRTRSSRTSLSWLLTRRQPKFFVPLFRTLTARDIDDSVRATKESFNVNASASALVLLIRSVLQKARPQQRRRLCSGY